jgi:hypothetical protein
MNKPSPEMVPDRWRSRCPLARAVWRTGDPRLGAGRPDRALPSLLAQGSPSRRSRLRVRRPVEAVACWARGQHDLTPWSEERP